jgi:Pyrimidine dimer DNA glycosylase
LRLWSLHPRYLDPKGLVALWREALLAQKVLRGKTRGYRNHPQLSRFKNHPAPRAAIRRYLWEIWLEARRRGYAFDRGKIGSVPGKVRRLPVTRGQLEHERGHLARKLRRRFPRGLGALRSKTLRTHPFLKAVSGPVENWEKSLRRSARAVKPTFRPELCYFSSCPFEPPFPRSDGGVGSSHESRRQGRP